MTGIERGIVMFPEMGLILIRFYLVFTISVLFLVNSFGQQDPNSDQSHLSGFLQKMGVPLKSSNFSVPVCSWKGVSCDNQTEQIVGLVLSGMGLSGSITENTIGKITTLVSLDLSSNFITGFSSDFWGLGSLKKLNLSSNMISGPIPDNFVNLGFLEQLDFSSNSFSGSISASLSSLSSLRILNLAENKLQGKLPSISNLGSLVYLNLSNNKFNGSVKNLGNNSLQIIDLRKNSLEGKIFEVPFNWSALKFLDFSSNFFSVDTMGNLSRAIYLEHLNLADNPFSPYQFPHISELRNLEYLNLSKTNLSGPISTEIATLDGLKVLDLSKNSLTGKVPVPPQPNPLTYLDLSWNDLSGEIPTGLQDKFREMEKFNFSYNNLTVCFLDNLRQKFPSAFLGPLHDCPNHQPGKRKKSRRFGLTVAIAISLCSFLAAIFCLILICKRDWVTKRILSQKDPCEMSGPFLFRTDSTTWVAEIKLPSSVPVIMLEKPLLKITFADLLYSTSCFDRVFLLAEDRYGPVYRAVLSFGLHSILRVLIYDTESSINASDLKNLSKIRHSNVAPITGYCLAGKRIILIYDYMENGTVYNWLHDLPLGGEIAKENSPEILEGEEDQTLWHIKLRIAIGTARALAFLHHGCSPQIVHGDVNSSKIYLDASFEAKLADWGLSSIAKTQSEDLNDGSLGYLAPEYRHTWSPTSMSDVYGFGVVLFELVTGKKPMGDEYPDCNEESLVGWVRRLSRENRASRAIDSKMVNRESMLQMETALRIGYLCTAENPSKRPRMQQVVGLLKDIEPSIGD